MTAANKEGWSPRMGSIPQETMGTYGHIRADNSSVGKEMTSKKQTKYLSGGGAGSHRSPYFLAGAPPTDPETASSEYWRRPESPPLLDDPLPAGAGAVSPGRPPLAPGRPPPLVAWPASAALPAKLASGAAPVASMRHSSGSRSAYLPAPATRDASPHIDANSCMEPQNI